MKDVWIKKMIRTSRIKTIKWGGGEKNLFHDRQTGWLAVGARQLPSKQNRWALSAERGEKTLLRTLLFRLQTKQTPLHNNEPADHRQINIRHDINVARVAICPLVVSFTGSPWGKRIQQSRLAQPRDVPWLHVSRIQSILGRIPVDGSWLAPWSANWSKKYRESRVNSDKNRRGGLKLLANIKGGPFPNTRRCLKRSISWEKVPKIPLSAASNALAS